MKIRRTEQVSVRLTTKSLSILDRLAFERATSRASVIEVLLRDQNAMMEANQRVREYSERIYGK